MRIQYCSDLHIEFESNSLWLKNNLLPVCGDVLILAGDIAPLLEKYFRDPFISYISNNYRKIFWIPGNHEYYSRNISDFGESINLTLNANISIVNNTVVIFDDIQFIFSTLWSSISPQNEFIVEQNVSDFEYISYKNHKLRASDFNKLHKDSLSFLTKEIKNKHSKRVIVTHHLPSAMCNLPVHNNSIINEAFCSNQNEIIINSNAKFWIYGHSHYNQKPLIIGDTTILTNQLGYVQRNEQGSFRPNAYFSI